VITYNVQVISIRLFYDPVTRRFNLAWSALNPRSVYRVEFRSTLTSGAWTPVLPDNPWSPLTTLSNIALVGLQGYYRVLANTNSP
jgi:hypothetical protein